MSKPATFEKIYPTQPFADLVRLSIRLGRLVGRRHRKERAL